MELRRLKGAKTVTLEEVAEKLTELLIEMRRIEFYREFFLYWDEWSEDY